MQSRMNMSKEVKKSTSKHSSSCTVIKHSVGIDMSKEKFDVCYKTIDINQHVTIKGSRSFPNTPSGFRQFSDWSMKRNREGVRLVFTMESTGVYYEALAFYLFDRGLHVSVLLPNRSKKYLQSLGIKSKTDRIDAAGLAQMGAEQNLPLWNRPDNWTVYLRQSTRQREQLQQLRTILKNQKEALVYCGMPDQRLIGHLEKVIQSVEKQLEQLEIEIQSHLDTDAHRKQRIEKICEIKGVGKLTVAVLLAETNCFKDFHSQAQLVSYAGYDVVENQSGKHAGPTKISKKGNAHIRRAMHMPALTVKTQAQDPVLTALWERVYERTRKKMKAYVAVQRKLLLLIYTLWNSQEKYIPGYKKKPCFPQG